MWLEDFSPEIESWEWVWNSQENVTEFLEKVSKTAQKSQSKVQKAGKDEKKAKTYDLLLAWFLVKIIVDKKYDFILEKLFTCIHKWFSSNFILSILSLINTDISIKIRQNSKKEIIEFDFKSKEIIEFHDNDIPPLIQKRINEWIEDIIDCISIEYSHLKTHSLIILLHKQNQDINEYISGILSFFLKESNIIIKQSQSKDISLFIINEVLKVLKNLELEEI